MYQSITVAPKNQSEQPDYFVISSYFNIMIILGEVQEELLMLKIFSTQLFGLFKKWQDNHEESIEDAARILAQASVGEGHIYIYGKQEMQAVGIEATEGVDALANAKVWDSSASFDDISASDRFLIITRESDDKEALLLAQHLSNQFIPFATISALPSDNTEQLASYSDVHFDLQLKQGLVPNESGERVGYPSAIGALFIYHGIKFTLDEILADY